MLPLALIATYFLGLALLYIIYVSYYQFTYWKSWKIPHLSSIPIFGNLLFLLQKVSYTDFSDSLYLKYPNARYCGYFDFGRPVMFLKDPELIRDVCIKNFENFMDHDQFVSEEMDPVVSRNLSALKGQRWKELRNVMTPSFTALRMKFLLKLMDEGARDFVQFWIDHPEETKCFELKELVTRYTTDIIATIAFGIKIDSMKDRNNEFYKHARIASNFGSFLNMIKFLLSIRVPKLMRLLGFTFLPKPTDQFLKKIINETIKARQEQGIVRQDLIHIMMQAMNKKNGIEVTMNDIMGQSFLFLLAGYDSTSSLICFLIHELATHPEVQNKLVQEIDEQLAETDGEISYESLMKMKFLDAVISETLRMHPVTPFLNRICVKDYVFPSSSEGSSEYPMKKGGLIMIPVYSLHRDHKYFPDPEKFMPERFNEENKNNINQYAYIPFGIGPRKCIGDRFVLMEAKILVVHLLRRFTVTYNEKTQKSIVYKKNSFNLTADNGFWISLESRKKID